ncbi:MAG: hypothetical protein NZM04_01000 [Methylacidiphilales bacterium]|nr:hypothetical protein [Candidatus Methylacidiphilales bacterium]
MTMRAILRTLILICVSVALAYGHNVESNCNIVGRFLSSDPLGHASDTSLYSYANNDPVNAVDPRGRLANGFTSGITGFYPAGSSHSKTFQFSSMVGAITGGLINGSKEMLTQTVLGDYSGASTTWDSVVRQIGVGLTPVGVAADMRDLSYAWGQARENGLNLGTGLNLTMAGVAFIPGAGDLVKGGQNQLSMPQRH